MENSLVVLLLLLVIVIAQPSITPEEFCLNRQPGTWCSEDRTGVYQCRINISSPISTFTNFYQCAPGTQCSCYLTLPCETILPFNPCLVPYRPTYPPRFFSVALVSVRTTFPAAPPINYTGTELTWYDANYGDGGALRVDFITSEPGQSRIVLTLNQASRNRSLVYTISLDEIACSLSIEPPLQRPGVPEGFLLINRTLVNGQYIDAFQYLERVGPFTIRNATLLTTNVFEGAIPVSSVDISGFRVVTTTNRVWETFTTDFFDTSVFEFIPEHCPIPPDDDNNNEVL